MLSANLHFVQTVVLALRLNGIGVLRNFSCSNRTKSSQIANSLTLLFIFPKTRGLGYLHTYLPCGIVGCIRGFYDCFYAWKIRS